MLFGCSRCGKVHERGACTLEGVSLNRGTQNVGYRKKWGLPVRGATQQQLFRNTAAWQRKRAEILKRDLYCCRVCLDNKILKQDHLQVHHIIPLVEDESLKLDDDNLISLCTTCHDIVEKDKSKRSYLQCLVSIPPLIR